MGKLKMEKTKDQKNALIVVLILIILIMSIGYASFASALQISGSTSIVGSWDVKFISLTKSLSTSAFEVIEPSYDATTIIFDVELKSIGDHVIYKATIKNSGTIDAKLSSVMAPNLGGTDAIIYSLSGISDNDVLEAGKEVEILITIEYNSDIYELPKETISKKLTITFNFVQNV